MYALHGKMPHPGRSRFYMQWAFSSYKAADGVKIPSLLAAATVIVVAVIIFCNFLFLQFLVHLLFL